MVSLQTISLITITSNTLIFCLTSPCPVHWHYAPSVHSYIGWRAGLTCTENHFLQLCCSAVPHPSSSFALVILAFRRRAEGLIHPHRGFRESPSILSSFTLVFCFGFSHWPSVIERRVSSILTEVFRESPSFHCSFTLAFCRLGELLC